MALHAVIPDQGIHNGVVKGVTHVKAARHVGWRNHDAIRIARSAGFEAALCFPFGVQISFDQRWVECLVH